MEEHAAVKIVEEGVALPVILFILLNDRVGVGVTMGEQVLFHQRLMMKRGSACGQEKEKERSAANRRPSNQAHEVSSLKFDLALGDDLFDLLLAEQDLFVICPI